MSFFKRLFESEEERTERLIRQRQDEALKKGIAPKIAMIAMMLGTEKTDFDRDEDIKRMWKYTDSVIRELSFLEKRDGDETQKWWQVKDANANIVFNLYDSGRRLHVSGYVPGPWEAHLESLYQQSLSVQAETDKKAAEAARKAKLDRRKSFGL